MSKSTRATLALAKAGVSLTVHSYNYDSSAERIGMQAAEAIGEEPRRVLKTLMAMAGSAVFRSGSARRTPATL